MADAAATTDVEVVLVSYRSRDLVLAMLERLRGLRIAVVDNAAGQDGLEEALAGRPGVRHLDGGSRGFAHAATLGAATSTATYVVFVNPDTRPERAVLGELVRELSADPGLAAVAPVTLDAAGRPDPGLGGFEPSLLRSLVHATGLHRVLPNTGLAAQPRPFEPLHVDWLSGACLAVRRSTFLALGGFDDAFFVYCEDVAFGRAVREAGLAQHLRTDLAVVHGVASSGGSRRAMFRQRAASTSRYLRRHHGTAAVTSMQLALTAGTLARAGAAAAQRRRSLAGEHLAYALGLWTGAPEPV